MAIKITDKIGSLESLETFREMKIDFDTGDVIIKDNEIIILEKTEAIEVWVYKTLLTDLNKYPIYSNSYGNLLKEEQGKIYSRSVKDQLLISEISTCLKVLPYITSVYDFRIKSSEDGATITINFKVDTIYESINIKKEVMI